MKHIVVANMNKIEAVNLACIRGGAHLFSGLNFSLTPGQALRVVGKNGCGKSSLLRIISGLLRPTEGCVTKTPNHLMTFLDHKILMKQELTVLENLEFWFDMLNPSQEQKQTAIAGMNLSPLLHLTFKNLSSGQKKRVQLCLLLLKTAQVWILDEPLLSLDCDHIRKLSQMTEHHLRNNGILIYASHDAISFITEQTLNLEKFRPEHDFIQAA